MKSIDKRITVLFAASEADPFVKVGGLADVAGSLPESLNLLPPESTGGNQFDVRLVLPFYKIIKSKISNPEKIYELSIPTVKGAEKASVYRYVANSVPVYLIDGEPIETDTVYAISNPLIDGAKFAFFSRAIVELIKVLDEPVELLHVNDWHTALCPYLLNIEKQTHPELSQIRSILTIHNLPFMGAETSKALDHYRIPPSQDERLPVWGQHFPLLLGLISADKIVAVSPNYAKEILTPDFGCGLEDLLSKRHKDLTGIVNGLDIIKWDPSKDEQINQKFDINHLERRLGNKKALLEEFDLFENPNAPLIAFIGRLDTQKGVDLILKALKKLKDIPWQMILLGTGDPRLEQNCRFLLDEYPHQFRAAIRFDGKLARALYSGADLLLMPSRYEPCGLAQMIAMRYGCLPLARATGGLSDTIFDAELSDNGTGFLFDEASPEALANKISQVVKLFHDRDRWIEIQKNAMRQNFAWEESALQYAVLYKELLRG
jgi:starch synthase